MEFAFDGDTFICLLIPQVAVVALAPFITDWFSTRNPSGAARAGMALLVLAGLVAGGLLAFLAMLGVGMSQARLGPLGSYLLGNQPALLVGLLALGVMAGRVEFRGLGTVGQRAVALMAGLVAFWLKLGLARDGLDWPAALLFPAVGAIIGLGAGWVVARAAAGGDRLPAARRWVVAGAVAGALGLLAGALLPGAFPYERYTPLAEGEPLATWALVLGSIGLWLGLAGIAIAMLARPAGARPAPDAVPAG